MEARSREGPEDALTDFLLSQIRNAFGEHTNAAAFGGEDRRPGQPHGQVSSPASRSFGCYAGSARAGRSAQFFHCWFRKEIDAALALDPQDAQAIRDLLEFYLVAPGIAGGDPPKAAPLASRIGEIQAPLGFLAAARIAAFRNHPQETEIFLRKAVGSPPPNYGARIALARFYLDQRAFQRAANAEKCTLTRALKAGSHARERLFRVGEDVNGTRRRGASLNLESWLATPPSAVPDDLVPAIALRGSPAYQRAGSRKERNALPPRLPESGKPDRE